MHQIIAKKSIQLLALSNLIFFAPSKLAMPLPQKLWQSDSYTQVDRPQIHFTVFKGRQTDINGFFKLDNQYHIAYQFFPTKSENLDYANVHWGHAISSDLLNWKERAPIIFPNSTTKAPPFSGTAVIDKDNVSKLRTNNGPVIIAFFTCAHYIVDPNAYSEQCIAYSVDDGKTWNEYKNNPILGATTQYARDPKVFFHSESNSWIMILALNDIAKKDPYLFAIYSSNNLLQWRKMSTFRIEGAIDCPDMFPMDDQFGNQKWVVIGGNQNYLVGEFDGKSFYKTQEVLTAEALNNKHDQTRYCSQTLKENERLISISWLKSQMMTLANDFDFTQQMTFPIELKLVKKNKHHYLNFKFIDEINSLNTKAINFSTNIPAKIPLTSKAYLIEAKIRLNTGETSTIKLKNFDLTITNKNIKINYTNEKNEIKRGSIQFNEPKNITNLEILMDTFSVEIIANKEAIFTIPSMPIGSELLFLNPEKVADLTIKDLNKINRD